MIGKEKMNNIHRSYDCLYQAGKLSIKDCVINILDFCVFYWGFPGGAWW